MVRSSFLCARQAWGRLVPLHISRSSVIGGSGLTSRLESAFCRLGAILFSSEQRAATRFLSGDTLPRVALKQAFVGRHGGTITVHSRVDQGGCRIVVADDGLGLPEGNRVAPAWKAGAMIVESLRQNARAQVEVQNVPGKGRGYRTFSHESVQLQTGSCIRHRPTGMHQS